MNNNVGELPEPEKEIVWRRIQNKFKGRSQYRPESHPGHFQKSKRNSNRSKVSTTDQAKKS